jgi:hypothetical protein
MAGKVWLSDRAGALLDEIPAAYKDIDQVMADQADLVTVLHALHQVLNYKAPERQSLGGRARRAHLGRAIMPVRFLRVRTLASSPRQRVRFPRGPDAYAFAALGVKIHSRR